MAGELEDAVREMMTAYDEQDYAKMRSIFSDDAQGVDELSRKWIRGREAIEAYFQQFGPMLSDTHSEIGDVHENVIGEAGVVTAWMEQHYKLNGQEQHFSGPLTVFLRRFGGDWKIALVHAVPLPPAAG